MNYKQDRTDKVFEIVKKVTGRPSTESCYTIFQAVEEAIDFGMTLKDQPQESKVWKPVEGDNVYCMYSGGTDFKEFDPISDKLYYERGLLFQTSEQVQNYDKYLRSLKKIQDYCVEEGLLINEKTYWVVCLVEDELKPNHFTWKLPTPYGKLASEQAAQQLIDALPDELKTVIQYTPYE